MINIIIWDDQYMLETSNNWIITLFFSENNIEDINTNAKHSTLNKTISLKLGIILK